MAEFASAFEHGRIRRWLPRHTDIDQLSDEEIQDIVLTANLTPRKCLGFKTPTHVILKEHTACGMQAILFSERRYLGNVDFVLRESAEITV
jgi:hypothetical protein